VQRSGLKLLFFDDPALVVSTFGSGLGFALAAAFGCGFGFELLLFDLNRAVKRAEHRSMTRS